MANQAWQFDDFHIGHRFPPSRYSIGAEDSDAFLRTYALGAVRAEPPATPPAAEESRPVRPVHPTLVASFQPQHAAFAWPAGVLHAREKVRLSAPVYPGEALEARVGVKDKYEKNDRKFVVLEILVRKLENGVDALTVERTLVWPT
ncbi:hypothetical protein CAL29_00575 [Bordetella genomosp. 10]|uniref:N-terminal of MaoC-like dehydratase domain-containing protein n=1 Tax=Bordetella genomosp. 10 TaxID=1416804 RepID=A0A261SKW2_9BORD|nr:MaoC family dehydratase [Bordetella genomosp. 10]OZI36973.1 hypothetical protein CAL29_00575 [Bordetella genomosp. 10]